MIFSFLRRKKDFSPPLTTDIHAHLLPGLDDGAKTPEEAKALAERFIDMGYKKLILTPHIMHPRYPNNRHTITNQLSLFQQSMNHKELLIEAAAEYFLDASLLETLNSSGDLMTFGSNYLLFEMNFFTESLILKKFISLAIRKGYKPVLAHPERYKHLHGKTEKMEELRNLGVLFQVNILSIMGIYSSEIRKSSIELINQGWVDFLGSDCHNHFHADMIEKAFSNKYVKKTLALPLLNRTL